MKNFVCFAVLALLVQTTAIVQAGNLKLFGDYSYGWSRITAATSSDLSGPSKDVANGLKSGTYNQFEIGTYIKGIGIGFIHNRFSSDANISYSDVVVLYNSYSKNGSIVNDFSLNFNGLELRYNIPLLFTGMHIGAKCGLGIESYKNKGYYYNADNINGQSLVFYTETTGSSFCSLLGAELSYSLLGVINFGIEASLMPGKFNNLKQDIHTTTISYNAMRFNAGIHIGVTL